MCVANVQHNCWSNTCRTNLCRTNPNKGALIYDGEDIQGRMKGIIHVNTDDIILNCSQLRNHHTIHIFCRQSLKNLTFKASIRESVEREMVDPQWRGGLPIQAESRLSMLNSIPEVPDSLTEQYCVDSDSDDGSDEEMATGSSSVLDPILEETERNDYDEFRR